MQFSTQIAQSGWQVALGWVLVVGGLSLAVQTLGFGQSKPGIAHMLHALLPMQWLQRQAERVGMRPERHDSVWQAEAEIAEVGLAQAEAVADLHARAAEEFEAVDDALVELLADFTPDQILSIRQRQADPASVSAD